MTRRLLIVEDSALVSGALRILFEESGFTVDEADGVAAAVASARAARPDVMLLDLTLPDGDGLSVLETLRHGVVALPRATIALTGHDDDATRERCMSAGCAAVLLKPVPVRELLALVRSL